MTSVNKITVPRQIQHVIKTAPRHRYHLTDRPRNETVLTLARNANTDSKVNCLLQPGHIRNQLFKSMFSTSFHLYNFVYPDSSCCRDKVSRAAGRRSVGSVFCSPFIKCTVTSKLRCYYRDWQKTRQPRHRRQLTLWIR